MESIRKKIFVVDDSPLNLKLARNTLMDLYDVFTVPSAEKMFALLEKIQPDLILLDIVMPGMSGRQLIKILKQKDDTKYIPVVFITGNADQDSELDGFNLGAADYVAKPFSPPILRKRVEVLLLMESQKAELKNLNENLQDIVNEKTKEVVDLQYAILKTVGDLVESRDTTTGSHIERVDNLMSMLLNKISSYKKMDASNFDPAYIPYIEEIETWNIPLVVRSGLLHDVGKIAIRDSILQKPAPLNDEEYLEMQKHTIFGEQIIEKIIRNTKEDAFLRHAKILAGTHHEKWDGKGYPRGLAAKEIPLQGRIMAIVDVYDALVSERPYKKAFPADKAIKIISEGAGSHFDPIITEIFIKAVKHCE